MLGIRLYFLKEDRGNFIIKSLLRLFFLFRETDEPNTWR